MEVKEQYQVKISDTFAVLENLNDDDVNINRGLESIRENIKASATDSLSYYGLKQLKSWFDKQCSTLFS
jgi:hypothetical protein